MSIATVVNNITLPKNLYKDNAITKDNKSRWEAASRKLRAIVPVLLNHKATREKQALAERRKSMRSVKSLFSKSSKSVDEEVDSIKKGMIAHKTRKLISDPKPRRSSVFLSFAGFRSESSFLSPKKKPKFKNSQAEFKTNDLFAPPPKEKSIEKSVSERLGDVEESEEFQPKADSSGEETDYHESSVFNTSEIEEEIVQQGVLSVVSQYNIMRS